MKTILIPTDFSEQALSAVKIGIEIARKTEATLYVLHIVQSPYAYEYNEGAATLPDAAYDRLHEQIIQAEAEMGKMAQLIREHGIDVQTEVQVGTTARHLSEFITNIQSVDLIVIGTQGDTGMHEFFIGSRTEKVVRFANCPVLSVRGNPGTFALHSLVLATDFDDEIQPLVNKLQELQEVFGFAIHIVYVNTPLNYDTTFRIEERMQAFLQRHSFQNYQTAIIDEYTQQDGIRRYAERIHADMIAMVTHGRTGIAHLLDGSVAESVVNQAVLPVLTYNIHE